MSLNEMIPSTNLVLCSMTTSRRTPDDKTYRASILHQNNINYLKKKKFQLAPDMAHKSESHTSTWNRQSLQDFQQGTRLQTSMTVSSAMHLVLHIQSLKQSKRQQLYYSLREPILQGQCMMKYKNINNRCKVNTLNGQIYFCKLKEA